MRLVTRDPDSGYFDGWLWMPKKYCSQQQIASALTYLHPKGDVCAWKETADHVLVPRNFLLQNTLTKLPYPVYDARWKAFPTTTIPLRPIELDKFSNGASYQKEAVEALLGAHDGILCLRTGAGKTLVGIVASAQLHTPVLVVVKDEGLCAQWESAILKHTYLTDKDIGHIDGSHPLVFRKPITIASVQTLARRVKEGNLDPAIPQYFGVVLIDEAHTMGAPYFNTAIPPFTGRRWGLTATPDRDDAFSSLLQYSLGEVVYTYLMPDRMPEVTFVQLPTKLDLTKRDVLNATHVWKKQIDPETGAEIGFAPEFHYGKTFGYLATLEERTRTIVRHVKAAVAAGRTVMVISQSKRMCLELAEQLPGSGLVVGSVKGKVRHERINHCNPVVIIDRLGIEAVDKPSLDTLFIVDPFKDSRRIQQAFGRILRSGSGSDRKRLVVMFEDTFVRPLAIQCGKARRLLQNWPEAKGGAIPYKITRKELR